MKDYYLTTSPSGIGLIQKEKMPIEPAMGICSEEPRKDCFNRPACVCADRWKPYRDALKRAKEHAVPVADNTAALNKIILLNKEVPEIGKVYGPFTGEYEIRKKCRYSGDCPDCELGKLCAQVAILSEPEEKEPVKESQEYSLQKENDEAKEWELWRDFLYAVGCKRYMLDGEDFMSTRWEELMDELKQHFTITRK